MAAAAAVPHETFIFARRRMHCTCSSSSSSRLPHVPNSSYYSGVCTPVLGRYLLVSPSQAHACTQAHTHTGRATPGKPNTRSLRPSPPRSSVAKVRGFPGFINTRPKCTLPFLSSRGLRRSRSPMDTPPGWVTGRQADRQVGLQADQQLQRQIHRVMQCHTDRQIGRLEGRQADR